MKKKGQRCPVPSTKRRGLSLRIFTFVMICFRTCSNYLLLFSVYILIPNEREKKNPNNSRNDIDRKIGQEHFQNVIYVFMKISVLKKKKKTHRSKLVSGTSAEDAPCRADGTKASGVSPPLGAVNFLSFSQSKSCLLPEE